jgi:glycosyltransferase involved in cell wall biosynthesis
VKLGILLLTYDRLQYARATLESLAANLRWSGDLHIHIADDGSPPEYRAELAALVEELWPEHGRSVTNAKRSGYGANFNQATQVLHPTCDVVLPLEDDWELERELNLDRYAAALGGDVQCIRLGYLGLTQPLRGEVRYVADVPLLIFDPNSEERHVSAGHPRIETVQYERNIGPWAEGLNPGATEFDWCGREASRRGVAWPLDIRVPGDLFGHIGAIQAREDQR